MNIENRLDKLKKIAAVDAPPFLYTRIRQRIQSLEEQVAPAKWRWAFALGGLLVLSLNLSIWLGVSNTSANKGGMETVVNSMQLSTNNELYR